MATPPPKIWLKLLIDPSSKKVLFAEAKKDFVDFLFGLLELPLGTILSLLRSPDMAGSGPLPKLYSSVKNLGGDYLLSNGTWASLLKPKIAAGTNAHPTPLLRVLTSPGSSPVSSGLEGHVKGVADYMVTDDLVVKPVSAVSSIALLNSMGVKDFASLEEKTVEVGAHEGLMLVKASFESTTVLTDVYFPTASKRKRE